MLDFNMNESQPTLSFARPLAGNGLERWKLGDQVEVAALPLRWVGEDFFIKPNNL